MKTNVLGIQFDNLTREEARQAGRELLRGSDFHYVVTPNPEFRDRLSRAPVIPAANSPSRVARSAQEPPRVA